jgi:glycosyltransferase involved in cell wall biosynthesis
MELKPSFSIIIPTYNRPKELKRCLDAISKMNYPRNQFEVIIVDDGSECELNHLIARHQKQIDLKFHRQENAGPAKARNAGATNARGKYLAFTDDDCAPDENWLQCFEARFDQTPNSVIGGKTINALPKNIYAEASQLFMDYLYEYYNKDIDNARFLASNNFAMPSVLFDTLGGFNTSFPLAAGEDRDFCKRCLYSGLPMRYAPEAHIYHAHRLTFLRFWRQHFNYGRGAFHFHQLCANQKHKSREPFLFYLDLLRYPFSRSWKRKSLHFSLLMIITQFANTAGYAWECMYSKG